MGATMLCACGTSGATNNQPAAQNQAAAAPAGNWATPVITSSDAAQPAAAAAPAGPTPTVTAQWLAGRWQIGGGPCASQETQFSFQPDGRYALGAEQGRWSLDGAALTIQVTQAPDGGVSAGERHTSQITAIDANTAEMRGENLPPVRIQRCR